MKTFNRILIVLGVFLLCFLITVYSIPAIVSSFGLDQSQREVMLGLSVFQALVLFILPSFVAARIVSTRPAAFLSLNRAPGWLPICGVFFAYLISLPFLNQIIYWNSIITFPDSLSDLGKALTEMEQSAAAASQSMMATSTLGGLFVNLAIIALLTAFAEEVFFRGALQRAFASGGRPYVAIWVVAVLFSAMHFQFFGFIPRLLLGAWFGYLVFWTRSLYVPVFAHFLNNGVVVLCSWLVGRGVDFDFDMLGVTVDGFPFPAAVSAVAFIIFIGFFRQFFFYRESSPGQQALLYTQP